MTRTTARERPSGVKVKHGIVLTKKRQQLINRYLRRHERVHNVLRINWSFDEWRAFQEWEADFLRPTAPTNSRRISQSAPAVGDVGVARYAGR
jgi:hypothetical protein